MKDHPDLTRTTGGSSPPGYVFVPLGVEVRRPSTARALTGAALPHIVAFRNGVRDPPGSQRAPVRLGSVRLVRGQVIEPLAGPAAATGPAHGNPIQQWDEFLGVRRLSGCEPGDQATAASLGEQMQFGGQSSARATHPLGCPRFGRGQPPYGHLRRAVSTDHAGVDLRRQSRSPPASASACNRCSIRAQVPSRSQRANRS